MKEKEKVLARVQERIDRGEVVAGGFTGNDIAGKGKVEGEKLQTGSGRSLGYWLRGSGTAQSRNPTRTTVLAGRTVLGATVCKPPQASYWPHFP